MTYILAINPGSTSTKISLYNGAEEVFTKTLRHSSEEIGGFDKVIDQFKFRETTIVAALEESGVKLEDLAAVVGRGGLLRPISSGVYAVNEEMVEDLKSAKYGEHASNLGGIIALEISKRVGCPAYIADPVVVDEMCDVARVGGHPMFPRLSIFHALNHKAIAKLYAKEIGRDYNDLNLVVAHLGGGCSIAAHSKGKVVDVNNALMGDGPFSPERTGGISAMQLAKVCFSGEYTHEEIKKIISGKGGIVAHLGTNSFKDVDDMVAAGDPKATLISDAFVYNVAKAIGGMAAALSGNVDGIVVTGGIAYGKLIMQQLTDMVKFIAPVKIYPGEDEMGALAKNAFAVIEGKEEVKQY
ncbi:MAG: butyrate kinase [Bacteroidales bacterium]|jgi:butyrate kinase|nr:butyrate kinase [Bacteroidales bacterium]MBO7283773.1 butyrate kinase [Bacteroidales bacterium]MBO7322940.1 butyrate kinase [Bacteroidales bacterium]MBQ5747988.1 butyrate kinase [Bacteroidales bacterium]MBR4975121.1 butyrate kinase [Bacteroidales bacterium]